MFCVHKVYAVTVSVKFKVSLISHVDENEARWNNNKLNGCVCKWMFGLMGILGRGVVGWLEAIPGPTFCMQNVSIYPQPQNQLWKSSGYLLPSCTLPPQPWGTWCLLSVPWGRQCSLSSLAALSSSGPVFAAGRCLWAQCVCPGDLGCVTCPQFDTTKWGNPRIGFKSKTLTTEPERFQPLLAIKIMGKVATVCTH